MVTTIILGGGGIAALAAAIAIMVRVDRRSQRALDRMRDEWEADGGEGPWPGRGNWFGGNSG